METWQCSRKWDFIVGNGAFVDECVNLMRVILTNRKIDAVIINFVVSVHPFATTIFVFYFSCKIAAWWAKLFNINLKQFCPQNQPAISVWNFLTSNIVNFNNKLIPLFVVQIKHTFSLKNFYCCASPNSIVNLCEMKAFFRLFTVLKNCMWINSFSKTQLALIKVYLKVLIYFDVKIYLFYINWIISVKLNIKHNSNLLGLKLFSARK